MIEVWHVQITGVFLLGILIGWGVTSSYSDYKIGKTIFNKKPQKPKGGFVQ